MVPTVILISLDIIARKYLSNRRIIGCSEFRGDASSHHGGNMRVRIWKIPIRGPKEMLISLGLCSPLIAPFLGRKIIVPKRLSDFGEYL